MTRLASYRHALEGHLALSNLATGMEKFPDPWYRSSHSVAVNAPIRQHRRHMRLAPGSSDTGLQSPAHLQQTPASASRSAA
jgi:hypothetical protein